MRFLEFSQILRDFFFFLMDYFVCIVFSVIIHDSLYTQVLLLKTYGEKIIITDFFFFTLIVPYLSYGQLL